MLRNENYIETLLNNQNYQEMLNEAIELSTKLFQGDLKNLEINNYEYSPGLAIEELGLDLELINQLIEDYSRQILNNLVLFLEYIEELQHDKNNNKELEYKNLRDLAHKNLGVARNLRIQDAEKILYKMMKDDDVYSLELYLYALVTSTIILKPKLAYDTLNLMKIKNYF